MEFSELQPRDQFILSRWFYSIGKPIISDAEYTILLNSCKQLYPNDEYVNRSWSSDPCPTELLKKIGREDAIEAVILSDKTESIESLNTWSDLGNRLHMWTGMGTLSYKHDGWNVQASYYNQHLVSINTRGRSTNAMRVDYLRAIIPNTIPVSGKVKVVMECTIPNHNFPTIQRKYGVRDQRASVSTILAHPEDIELLDCHAFDVHGYLTDDKFATLESWGFKTPMHMPVMDYQDITDTLHELDEAVDDYDSPTDGVVFDGGFKYAIRLLHWEETLYQSYVIGYEESFNRYVISPRLKIRPILRGGVTQKFINITNWQRIIDMNLQPGAPLAFNLVSGAIANINEFATYTLQKQFEGQWDTFKDMVDEAENSRRAQALQESYYENIVSS